MSTGADTANAASFLTGSNLFHLNLDTKLGCQHFDQLPEVDTLIGNIIEYCFVAVTLILHIADLHLQSQLLSNLTGADHGRLLLCFCLFIFLQIGWAGKSVDATQSSVVVFAEVVLLHLELHQLTGEGDRADVMTRE